jgi:cation transport regulator ChaC
VGRAYLIEPDVFQHLDHREKNGYERVDTNLTLESGDVVAGKVYIAPEGNFAWLGDAPNVEIAQQIAGSAGPSGLNRDYLLHLADALRELDTHDEHVFELERLLARC